MLALARLVARCSVAESRTGARHDNQPAALRCFATPKVRENYVKVWLAAPP